MTNLIKKVKIVIDMKNKSFDAAYKENEKKYKELGIDKTIKKLFKQYKDENIKLDKQEITIEEPSSQILGSSSINLVDATYSTTDTTNLSPYNGYSMRYVTVNDFAHKEMGNILSTGGIWGEVRNKTLDFIADRVNSNYIGIICNIIKFGADVINESYAARADILTLTMNHNYEYKMYEIYDTDKIYNGGWYCLGYSTKDVVTGQLTLSADIDNDRQLEYGYGSPTRTYYSPYYFSTQYMQQKVYDAYKGNSQEFYDRTPAYITVTVK